MSRKILEERVQARLDARRLKFIKFFPRAVLEGHIDNIHKPWHWDRATLNARVLARWDDELRDDLLSHIREQVR